jgi:hypothetical protein
MPCISEYFVPSSRLRKLISLTRTASMTAKLGSGKWRVFLTVDSMHAGS